MELWTDSINWLEIVINVVVIVLVPLVGVGLLAAGGVALVKTVKAIVNALRFMVDEPGDVLIVKLGDLTGVSREELVIAIRSMLDAIDKLPEDPPVVPPVEVNIGGAVQ